MAAAQHAGDVYRHLDSAPPSPTRLHDTGELPRQSVPAFLSPLGDASERPQSPPFQIQSMGDIRASAKNLSLRSNSNMVGMEARVGRHDNPTSARTGSLSPEVNEFDEAVPVQVVLTDSPTWLLTQKRTSEMVEGLKNEVDMVDKNGWSCLHWAALAGKEGHVAILLDCGADWTAETRVPIQHVSGDRMAGTTAEELARYPGGAIKGHASIIAMLQAAERGGWQQRKMCKQNADAAVVARDWELAVHWFEKALGAVLQVEDTPVCRIVQALRDARQQVERERAERIRLEEQRRKEAQKREEERLRREEEDRLRQRRRHRALQEGKQRLRVGDGRGAIKSAVAAMEGMEDLQELVLAASKRVISDEVKAMEAILDEKLRVEKEKMETKINEAEEAAQQAHHLRVLEAAEYARKLAEETAMLKEAKDKAERDLLTEKKRLNAEMEKLKEQLHLEMERYRAEKNREVELAKAAQDRAQKECNRVTDENIALKDQYRMWQIEREEMLAEMDRFKNLVAEMQKQIAQLLKDLEDLERLRLMEKEFKILRAERDALQQRVAALEKQLQAAVDEIARLNVEHEHAMSALRDLLKREQTVHAMTTLERDTVSARCSSLVQNVQDLKARAAATQVRHERELAEALAELERRLREEVAEELRQMERDRQASEKRAMSAQKDLADLRAETSKTIRAQQLELIDLQERLSEAELRNEILRADAKAHDIERQEWQVERERLMEEHRRRVERLQVQHAANLLELKERQKELEAKLAASVQELLDANTALAEAESLNERIKKEMQMQIAECSKQIEALTRRMNELKVQLEATQRKLEEAQRAIIANAQAAERARREAAELRGLLAQRDAKICGLEQELRQAQTLQAKLVAEHQAALALVKLERKALEAQILLMHERIDEIAAELSMSQAVLQEAQHAHVVERTRRLETERQLGAARAQIEQLLETIRLKDEALRALTEEAKQAVIKATDFLAVAVRRQQEDLQVAMRSRMTAVTAEIDQRSSIQRSRPITADDASGASRGPSAAELEAAVRSAEQLGSMLKD